MKMIFHWLCSLCLWAGLLCMAGCGIPGAAPPAGETRVLTDGVGMTVRVPAHPTRVVSVGVSTDDVLISVMGTDRIIAIAKSPSNMPGEAAKIKNRISDSTESIISLAPDLVIVPDWKKAEYAQEIRAAGIPVYVYAMPGSVEGMIAMIHELADVVNEPEGGNRLAQKTEERVRSLDAFVAAIPREKRKVVVSARANGIGGGKGSTFDGLCAHAGVINGAAEYGISSNAMAGREALIGIGPDIIFVPTDDYTGDGSNARTLEDMYSDPALQVVPAIRDRQCFIIDAKWMLSYSQFMVNAMEEMAHYAYGYNPEKAK